MLVDHVLWFSGIEATDVVDEDMGNALSRFLCCPSNVWCDETIRCGEERIVGLRWFYAQDVSTIGPQPSALQGIDHGSLISNSFGGQLTIRKRLALGK